MQFSAELGNLHSMLSWVIGELAPFNPPVTWVHELELSLEEAIMNIITYAYPSEQKGSIYLEILEEKDFFIVTIKDQGRKFNPLVEAKSPKVHDDLHLQEEGGLGLYLMQKNVDQMLYNYEKKQNILTLIKKKP